MPDLTDEDLRDLYVLGMAEYSAEHPRPPYDVDPDIWLDYCADRTKFALRHVVDAATLQPA